MKRSSLTVLTVCILAFAGSSASAGGQTQFPTFFDKYKFQASGSGATFSGKIDSAKSKCVKDRKINLFRKKNGNKTKLGSDKTNNKGKFSIKVGSGKLKNGKYFAEAKQSTFTNDNGQKVTCLDVKSGSVTVS